jgi:hypothetical protein
MKRKSAFTYHVRIHLQRKSTFLYVLARRAAARAFRKLGKRIHIPIDADDER